MHAHVRPTLVAIAAGVLAIAMLMFGLRTALAADQNVNWVLPTESSVTVNPGDTVTWTWGDSLPHTVTSLSGPESFSSGTLTGSGQTFAFTFNTPGTYTYQCDVHPGGMTGTVVVQAAGQDDGAGDDDGAATATPGAPPTGTGLAPESESNSQAMLLSGIGAMLVIVSTASLVLARRRV